VKVVAIGECMVEFSPRPEGGFMRSFGGDTLNFAVYLARLGITVDYATVLGDDPFSDEMVASWKQDGVGTATVERAPGRMPGLYVVHTDAKGERSFHYWRDTSPARDLFKPGGLPALAKKLAKYDWFYLTGISLSLYGRDGCKALFTIIDAMRERGAKVAFDGNYRPRVWGGDSDAARAAVSAMLKRTDLLLPTFEDEQALFGYPDVEAYAKRVLKQGVAEAAIKLGSKGCLVVNSEGTEMVAAETNSSPFDTTAAGDSFNAGYMAARLKGLKPVAAAHCANRLAAEVIRHPGAIIPAEAMPRMLLEDVA